MGRLRILATPVALLFATVLTHPAEAHHAKRHHHSYHHYHRHRQHIVERRSDDCALTNDGRRICGPASQARRVDFSPSLPGRMRRYSDAGKIIGSRPAGCPHAYCGCGLRKYLGLSDKRLNLARNWARLFPHEPAPRAGLAAVRSGHVMYIEGRSDDGHWIVRDYNSGGGLSRLHERSVRGYVFVNPSARVAQR
jgi:hypothetical protein